jgi:uroporphyrinogen III methyltransferase / synthase
MVTRELWQHLRVSPGLVSLIGAGPGDPGLMTLKGVERLREADAIVYDYLVNPEILKYARPDAEIVYAGKKAGKHTLPQEEINALLVQLAQSGKRVARLKGGDPFVFGRGGEEATALHEAEIPFEIIPGISSAIAAPAYAGIPVTHRDFVSSFTVITGHERKDVTDADTRLDWASLAKVGGTLVFLMGVGQLDKIAANLTEAGLSPDTPAAVVQWGTYQHQRTVVGTVATIHALAQEAGIKPPAVTVIGQVVALRDQLAWFDALNNSGLIEYNPELAPVVLSA